MTINDPTDHSDYELFKKVCSASHSLYHLLSLYHTSDLHLHGHSFQLPEYYTDLHKKSFTVRSLYEHIKWNRIGIILLICHVLLSVFLLCFMFLFSMFVYVLLCYIVRMCICHILIRLLTYYVLTAYTRALYGRCIDLKHGHRQWGRLHMAMSIWHRRAVNLSQCPQSPGSGLKPSPYLATKEMDSQKNQNAASLANRMLLLQEQWNCHRQYYEQLWWR